MGPFSYNRPAILDAPGLARKSVHCVENELADIPSIQPYSPRLVAFSSCGGQRAIFSLEGPKEQGVIRMALPIYRNVSRKAASEVPGDVG